jgi:hypothetical protein
MMLRRDVLIVLGFAVFLWITMCFIMLAILHAVGASNAKNILIAIGVITLFFATASLGALILHLRKHSTEMYAEELRHAHPDAETLTDDAIPAELTQTQEHPSTALHGPLVKVFDILFIMVLCFITLLATMLLRGHTVNNKDIYTVGVWSAPATVVGFTLYFLYILRHSQRELKLMVEELYREEEAPSALIADQGARE